MRLALLSDIHSNLEAFQACLRHARKQGVDQFAILGDLVGYGADPVAVVEAVMELQAAGATVLMGNHDQAVVADERSLSPGAREVAVWTRQQLSAVQLAFLRALPMTARQGWALWVHGSAHEPDKFHYVQEADVARQSIDAAPRDVRLIAAGHVHEPRLWHFSGRNSQPAPFRPSSGVAIDLTPTRRWMATIGSVGQPRDGNPAGSYAIVDLAQSRITFFRIPYDHAITAQKIRAAGLPDWNAQRLALGK
ncbi:MAG: metallophosphatase family protein [Rhodocyclaceae bacterium]|jgi:diadenosine tetraphosphatase ApaH/serine/threonine PP2A family protein phosphatase|nr:metallophosphatase family protein [Rhodocyclaceae bacterium]MBK6908565.1 metallophosphatase family protein [Rhodocyclaceae bacterium]